MSCNTADTGRSGFSLLEIVVVLVLMAAVASLVVPKVMRMYDSMLWANERDQALEALGSLGYEARVQGREFDLTRYPGTLDGNMTMPLPPKWTLRAKQPIRYRASGVCLGGTVTLNGRGRSVTVKLEGPLCRPETQ